VLINILSKYLQELEVCKVLPI